MGDHGTCLFTLLDPRQPRCHLVLKKDKFNFFDGREHYLIEMCFIHLLYKLYYSIDYISSHVFAKKFIQLIVHLCFLECASVDRHRKTKETNQSRGPPLKLISWWIPALVFLSCLAVSCISHFYWSLSLHFYQGF
jgi:hypothetical protein